MAYDGSIKFDTSLDDKGLKNGLGNLNGAAGAAGKALAAAFGTVAAGIGAAVKVGMNFESSMSQVAATMGITSAEIAAGSKDYEILSKAAKDAGATTQFSASQAAQALNYLALAGYDAATAADVLPSVLNLAAAGGMDLAYASDLATDAMAALGIEANNENLTHFGDELAKTAQKSNTSVSQLGEAILVCAGQAKGAGQSLETLNTALGVMANRGIKGSEGGTHLRNILKSLVSPTTEASKKLKELNVSVADSEGNIRDLGDILGDLKKSLSGLTQEKQLQALNEIFNSRDSAAAQAMIAGLGDEWDNLKNQISNADGAMANMAETMNDNLKGKLTILGSSLESLGIAVYEGIEDPMKSAVEAAIDSVGRITKSLTSGELKPALENVGTLLGRLASELASTLGAAVSVAIKLLSALAQNLWLVITPLKMATAAFIALKAAMAITAVINAVTKAVAAARLGFMALSAAMNVNPLVLAVTAAAALGVGIYEVVKAANKAEFSPFHDKIEKLADEIEETTKSVTEMKDTINDSVSTDTAKYDQVRLLADELMSLADATGTVSDKDKARAQFILGELNSALGTEYTMTGNQINQYQTLAGEVANVIAMKQAEATLETLKTGYDEAVSNKAAAYKQQADALALVKAEQGEVNRLENEFHSKVGMTYDDAVSRMNELSEASQTSTQEYQKLKRACDEHLESMNKVKPDYDAAIQAYQDATDNVKNCEEAISQYTDLQTAVIEKDYGKIGKILAEYQAQTLLANDGVELSMSELSGKIKNFAGLYSELSSQMTLGAQQQVSSTEQYLGILIRKYQETGGSLESLYPIFSAAGVENAEAFVNGLAKISESTGEVQSDVENVVDSAASGAEPTATSGGQEVGANLALGIASGITSNSGKIKGAATSVVNEAIAAAKAAGDIHSPSRKTRDEVGAMLVEGVVVGITSKIDKVPEAFEKMLDDIKLQLELGAISDAEYYEKLEGYRDEYLTKGSDKWWEYTKQIIKYEDELTEQQRDREVKRLDNLKELQIISERDYYKQLEVIRDKYLEKGSDKWEEYTLKIAKYWRSSMDSMVKDYTSQLSAVHSKMDSLKDKFTSAFSLSHSVTLTLEKQGVEYDQSFDVLNTDIDAYTQEVKQWSSVMEQLKNREGMADGYMAQLMTQDPSKAYQLAQQMLKMSDDDFKKYMDSYKEYTDTVDKYSKQFYKSEEREIAEAAERYADSFVNGIETGLDDLDEIMGLIGYSSAEAFADEFKKQISEAMVKVQEIIAGTGAGIYLGGMTGTGASYQYNTYQLNGSGETVAEQLRACRDAATVEKLRGGYS